mmetsp:Transcript_27469/g.73976  ORF Transcript_27469/g.73976 Transcript_27469/m.73976 type:complete len:83 (+) Transcript_27469:413-661(+)
MRWTEMWHDFLQNSTAMAGFSKQQKGSWGFSHQLQYDTQSCIRGFIELLKEQERRHAKVALLGRKIVCSAGCGRCSAARARS